jgi:hypothetical protein
VLFSVDDAADPTAADKASWVGLPALTEESRSCGAAWQAHVTVPRNCTPPTVSALSASSVPGGVTSTLVLSGSHFGFGPGLGLFGISYSNGTNDWPCAPATWTSATSVECTVSPSLPLYTLGLHLRVFVSGMVTVSTQRFSVLSQSHRAHWNTPACHNAC